MPHVFLIEWETKNPENCSVLKNLCLPQTRTTDALIRFLGDSGRLELLQLPRGLEIRTTSWVGQLAVGELTISISPKIPSIPLIALLRYAYRLRHLQIFSKTDYASAAPCFADLLVAQLAAETSELLSRGLHRDYLRFDSWLPVPRGRVDFLRLANGDAAASSSLPCAYFDRSEGIPINRVLLSGLQLSWRIASDPLLRRRVAGLVQVLASVVTPEPLTRASFATIWNMMDRRTSTYAAALHLIQLLHEGCGFQLGRSDRGLRLPGFLLDMNAFFQNLMSRFLKDEAEGFSIQDQHRIHGIFTSDPVYPPRRTPPVLRPDFAVFSEGELIELLDAKYRNLWSVSLPAEMLYQLAMYALSNPKNARAVIVYPTVDAGAVDQAIQLREPVYGGVRGSVALRPVNLIRLSELVADHKGLSGKRERRVYARRLVFGDADCDGKKSAPASEGCRRQSNGRLNGEARQRIQGHFRSRA